MRRVLHNLPLSAPRAFQVFRWVALVLAFAAVGGLRAGDGAGARETAVAPGASRASTLQAYAARAASLRRKALQTGRLTYREVVEAAYAPGAIDESVLAAKARWRAAAAAPTFEFVTDYADTADSAAVQPLIAMPDARLHSTLVAQYEATANVVGLSPAAADYAVFHEAGHSLQRALLLQGRGGAAARRPHETGSLLERPLRAGIADATSVQRLNYLCAQDEFEVRLQDLNRFHALLVDGRPILDAHDSLRALVALGMPLDYEDARQAFAAAGRELPREQFARDTAIAPVPGTEIAVAFEDARELLMARQLALRVDEAFWHRMLAKIVFEAPGHF